MKHLAFQLESKKSKKLGYINLVFEQTYVSIFHVFRFLTQTSLLLALNGVMVVIFCFLVYSCTIKLDLLLATFLVTFAVYGLNKVTDKIEDSINQPEKPLIASSYWVFFSFVSMIFGFLLGLMEGIMYFVVLLAPVIIGIVYSVGIFKSVPRLKEIVGVKSLSVAVSWAIAGCFLPGCFSAGTAIIFVYVFIKILVGTILCDVLDEKGDLVSKITTVPLRLGRKKTKKLLLFANSLSIILLIYCVATGIFFQYIPALLFGVLYGYISIWFFFRDNCSRLAAGLILDSEWLPIVIIVCLLIT